MTQTPGPAIIHKLIFELRYDYGYTYMDRCGAILNDVLRKYPGWLSPEATPSRGVVLRVADDLRLCFSHFKLDLSHEQSEKVAEVVSIEEFARITDELTKIVVERLEVSEFGRIGFRSWRMFGLPSYDGAKRAVIDLQALPRTCFEGLGIGDVEEVSWQIVGERNAVRTRLAVAAFQQRLEVDPALRKAAADVPHKHPVDQKRMLYEKVKAQKLVRNYPEFGILVDTDHYIEEPPYPDRLKVSEFITSSFDSGREISENVLHLKG
nr:hypothetical protein [Planctomycetota bacterium]